MTVNKDDNSKMKSLVITDDIERIYDCHEEPWVISKQPPYAFRSWQMY